MKIPPSLETERLIIRPYVAEDLEALLSLFNDKEVTRFLLLPLPQTRQETEKFLEQIVESYGTDAPTFALAITLKEDGRHVGSCGLNPLEDELGVQYYCTLSSECWGKGFATEAISTLFEYAFTDLGLERIVASINPENIASLKLAKRLGMIDHGLVEDKGVNQKVRFHTIDKSQYLGK